MSMETTYIGTRSEDYKKNVIRNIENKKREKPKKGSKQP